MTKYKLLPLFILILGYSIANAQEKGASDLRIGYGIGTSNDMLNLLTDAITYPASLGTITYTNEVNSGAIFLEYNYAIKNKLTLGVDLVYEGFFKDVVSFDTVIGKQRDNTLTFGVKCDYNYLSKPTVRLYSGIALAFSLMMQQFTSNDPATTGVTNANNGAFNFQVTGIGVRYGKQIAGFAELGFGYKGILSAGLSFQF